MTINEMRCYILDSYPHASQKWRASVLEMPSNQIVAIFRSILSRAKPEKRSESQIPKETCHQMDIWEYLAGKDASEDVKGSHTDIPLS